MVIRTVLQLSIWGPMSIFHRVSVSVKGWSDACPRSNGLTGWHGNQRAGVGQAPRDETAGRKQGASGCWNTMGI
jgi:hypothetical protein